MNDYSESLVQLSDEQFESLVRENGDIVNLDLCYHVLTAGQVELLSDGDLDRYEKLIDAEW